MIIKKGKKVFKEFKIYSDFLNYLCSIENVKSFPELEIWFNKNINREFKKSEFNYKIIQKEIFGKSIKSIFKKEYWLQRGYSEEEAKLKISEIQKENAKKSKNKAKSLSKEEYNAIFATSSKEYFKNKYGQNWEKHYKEYNKKRTNNSLKSKIQYWINKGYSEEEAKLKVKEFQSNAGKKAVQKLKNGEYFIPTQIQYWINKGYSEEEAKLKVSERQSTFSLDKLIKKYGFKKGTKIFESRQKIWQENYKKTCFEKYGVSSYVETGNVSNNVISKGHQEIIDFIKENYDGEIKINDRSIIKPLELDIYIPEFNFAIEFDGLFWHSNIDENYHLTKTEKCEEKNIHLFHIFENEWNNKIKQDIWKSKILYKLNKIQNKIYARNCIIKEISKDEELEFLEFNHLQGWVPSKYKLGMFYNNELISVLSVGKSRFKKDEWELLRFASKKYTIVIGSFSKFLKYIKNNFEINNLVSYGNRRWTFKNNVYSNFKLIGITKPNYFYIKGNNLLHRMNFQKHKLQSVLPNFNSNFTEKENMLLNNFKIIYDSGNYKYKLF